MPAWDYEAVDAQGRVARGRIDADSARGARDRLRAQGLTPVDMREGRATFDALAASRLPARELALFTRQWATLAQSGLPVDQALAAVAEQADSPRTAKLVTALRGHVEAGEALPAALARFPRTFAPLYRGLVAAGAESGRLADVLARLADYLEARTALRQKFTVALIYPSLVTLVALGVIAVLLVYVVPQVVAVYEHSRQTLALAHACADRDLAVLPCHRVAVARAGARRSGRVRARTAPAGPCARDGTHSCCACPASAGSRAASTPRASRARSRSWSAAARRSCARSTPRPG